MRAAVLLFATGCAGLGHPTPDDPDAWFDPGSDLDVEEPLAFTDQPYDFTGETPIAGLPAPAPFESLFEPGALPTCPDWATTPDLPREITGIVTLFPRLYYKTEGCDGDDEKYYGSYFIQDQSGGIFVLGDSKVAHFDAGDRVTLSIRGIADVFDLPMVTVHDVLAIDRGPEPIYYEIATQPFDLPDIALVRRIEGEVVTTKDTFGAFKVEAADGTQFDVSLDVELNRRGVDYPIGTHLIVTGPVLYSYSIFSIVVMQIGQVEVLDAATGSPG
jgi:hypothetical protein